MHFVFPSDSLDRKVADEFFRDQFQALRRAGFTTSLVSCESTPPQAGLRGIPPGSEVVYRGWMLKPDEYADFARAIEQSDAVCLTSPAHYAAAHYLPNWYPLLADLTPETCVFSADVDVVATLRELDWPAFFIKDFVKSLKTSPGPIVRHINTATEVVAAMVAIRGEVEGGLCVRRVEDFEPDSEIRYFVLHGKVYSSVSEVPIPQIVQECARRIDCPFFSVDVARRTDGVLRVVEIGDGQVSDLVGWTVDAFVEMWVDATT